MTFAALSERPCFFAKDSTSYEWFSEAGSGFLFILPIRTVYAEYKSWLYQMLVPKRIGAALLQGHEHTRVFYIAGFQRTCLRTIGDPVLVVTDLADEAMKAADAEGIASDEIDEKTGSGAK